MRSIPKLKVPRAEADLLIRIQIERGKAISPGDISNAAIMEAADNVDRWEEETKETLSSIIDTEEFTDEFSRAATIYQRGGDQMQMLRYSSVRIIDKNYALDDIRKKLALFSEPEPSEPVSDFWELMNPKIVGLTRKKFVEGHLADSVEKQP